MSAAMFSSEEAITDAALDLIAEVIEVEEPHLMHAHLARRCAAQPERMAQLVMCLAIWSSASTTQALTAAADQIGIQRARARLVANVGDEREYIRRVQQAVRATRVS